MKDATIYTILLIFSPILFIWFTLWYLFAGRKGHGDFIVYHDGIDNF